MHVVASSRKLATGRPRPIVGRVASSDAGRTGANMMLARTILVRMLQRRRARRRSLAGLVAAVAAAAIVVVSPSPASASGDNFLDVCDFTNYSCQTGTPSSAPAADKCAFADSSYGGTMVCVAYTGDKVYVWDGKSDGNAA